MRKNPTEEAIKDIKKIKIEIQQLKNQKISLEESNRAAVNHLSSIQKTISSLKREIPRLDSDLEPLRVEKASLEVVINRQKSNNLQQKQHLESLCKSVLIKIEESNRLIKECNEKKRESDLKLAEIKTATRKKEEQETKTQELIDFLETEKESLKLEKLAFKNSMEPQREELEEQKQSHEDDVEALEEVEQFNEDVLDKLNNKEMALNKKEQDLHKRETDLIKKIGGLSRLQSDILRREEELVERESTFEITMHSINEQQNLLKLDKLRIEKLAKDKGVEKEYARLKKELNQK